MDIKGKSPGAIISITLNIKIYLPSYQHLKFKHLDVRCLSLSFADGSYQKKLLKENFLNMGGISIFFVFVRYPFFLLKTSKNAMKHMILSFKMMGGVISDHFLMLWFQKDSLDTVFFRTFRGGPGFLIKSWILVDQRDIWIPKCFFYRFFWWLP